MPRVLIFVRHGVRGFPPPCPPTETLTPAPLLLAYKEDLNFFGHLHAYKLGQWIKEKYGQPDLLYGDVTYPRTVDTSISIGYGAGLRQISLGRQNPDTLFNPVVEQTPELVQATAELLASYSGALRRIRRALKAGSACPKLQKSSAYNIQQNAVTGLQAQAYTLGVLMFLGQYSQIRSPYLGQREAIAPIVPMNWDLTYPTRESVRGPAETFLGVVRRLLRKKRLSVLVGHEHNAIILGKYLQKKFQVPDFPEWWIPPTSGFIFQEEGDSVAISILYLTPEGQFRTQDYLQVRLTLPEVKPSLQVQAINY